MAQGTEEMIELWYTMDTHGAQGEAAFLLEQRQFRLHKAR